MKKGIDISGKMWYDRYRRKGTAVQTKVPSTREARVAELVDAHV